jgi:hypothetical protein
MKNFRARLRFCFLQTRANPDQSFQTKYNRDRQIATSFIQRASYLLLAFVTTPLQLRDLPREIAVSKTAFGNLAHGDKTSVSVE